MPLSRVKANGPLTGLPCSTDDTMKNTNRVIGLERLIADWRETLRHISTCRAPGGDCARAWAEAALKREWDFPSESETWRTARPVNGFRFPCWFYAQFPGGWVVTLGTNTEPSVWSHWMPDQDEPPSPPPARQPDSGLPSAPEPSADSPAPANPADADPAQPPPSTSPAG